MQKAVIDRFEGDWAVVMIEGQAEPVNLLRSNLPSKAREGDHLQIELTNEKLTSVQIDGAAKQDAVERIKGKIDRLRRGDHLTETE
jgi:hypothetical protein